MNEQEKQNVLLLLKTWKTERTRAMYEHTTNIEQDLEKIEQEEKAWKDLFKLD